jgi:septum formation protein
MLVLASASPRRRELLIQAGYDFEVAPANILEERLPDEGPAAFVMRLAQEKARAVFEAYAHRSNEEPLFILGADTIVVIAGEILGKPQSPEDAARMLRMLSGRTHQVMTGVSILSGKHNEVSVETTLVTMQEIAAREMAAYIATGEPMDKAGSYAIQGHAARWIPRIEGCYFNVVGLPIARVVRMLESAGLEQAGR